MGRIYGGILGLLAFQTTLARGWIHESDPQATMWTAWLCLMIFAFIGLIVGHLAGQVVRESVTDRMNAELAAQEEKSPNQKQG